MGLQKREAERLESVRDAAEQAAIRAGAITHCDNHDDVVLSVGGNEEEKRAYAIATSMWKDGQVDGSREEILEAVKDIIATAADGCPYYGCS